MTVRHKFPFYTYSTHTFLLIYICLWHMCTFVFQMRGQCWQKILDSYIHNIQEGTITSGLLNFPQKLLCVQMHKNSWYCWMHINLQPYSMKHSVMSALPVLDISYIFHYSNCFINNITYYQHVQWFNQYRVHFHLALLS